MDIEKGTAICVTGCVSYLHPFLFAKNHSSWLFCRMESSFMFCVGVHFHPIGIPPSPFFTPTITHSYSGREKSKTRIRTLLLHTKCCSTGMESNELPICMIVLLVLCEKQGRQLWQQDRTSTVVSSFHSFLLGRDSVFTSIDSGHPRCSSGKSEHTSSMEKRCCSSLS